MDSSRSDLFLVTGLILASSFGMGVIGASVETGRLEARQAREAAAVDRELDQIQEDLEDLEVRLKRIDERLDRIEELIETMPIESLDEPT